MKSLGLSPEEMKARKRSQNKLAVAKYQANNKERIRESSRASSKRQRQGPNGPKIAARTKDWIRKNTAKRNYQTWTYSIKRNYGITPEEFTSLLISQGCRCGVCGGDFIAEGGHSFGLSVDHCHDTGDVRGLLCSECNFMLGKGADDPTRLRRGADYIQENKR